MPNTYPKVPIIALLLMGVLAILTAVVYVFFSLQASNGRLLMPLDDTYIHFQYAKQLTTGYPYQYNIGDAPTSGATSFVYPYLLAVGYFIGFRELNLGYWAIFIGTFALFLSMWAMVRAWLLWHLPNVWAISGALIFGITGSFAWHFMSGMETGLVICATLWVFVAIFEVRYRLFIVWAFFLACLRPETGIMVVVACVLFAWQQRKIASRSQLGLLFLPMSAIAIQPLINWLITGTAVATGNQSKSILGTIPLVWSEAIQRILENFLRMWSEWITGQGYLPPLLTLLVLASLVFFLRTPNRYKALIILAWFILISGAISTLDNAFWHFKRYQMPLIVLIIALFGFIISYLYHTKRTQIVLVLMILWAWWAVFNAIQYLTLYALNISYVYQQPYSMALWLRENTPTDSTIAVHDVGMMRYIGERSTLDMVGLTTPQASTYWRNGVGSVAEFLLREQPDYIASYGRGHGYGLGYLEETALMQNPLAVFEISNWQPENNVALASNRQAIYQPNWSQILTGDFEASQTINVADLQSELHANYTWQSTYEQGFITEVYTFPYDLCTCDFTDGGRLINGRESFTLFNVDTTQGFLLRTLVHPMTNGILEVRVNGEFFAHRTIIQRPGTWSTIETYIPSERLESTTLIELIPQTSAYYAPYHHWITPIQSLTAAVNMGDALMQYLNNFTLMHLDFEQQASIFEVTFDWVFEQQMAGDYRMFVHLYDDLNSPPVAQTDVYLPFGVWAYPDHQDTLNIDIAHLVSGEYTLAFGFYDPYNNQRLVPTYSTYDILDGRVIVQKVNLNRD
jgi:hypothetical protein